MLARQLPTSLLTLLLWRARYQAEALAGILEDRPWPWRPKEISAAALIETTLHSTPMAVTHWSVGSMEDAGCQSRGRATHLEETLRPATSGARRSLQHRHAFGAKVRDIIALYLSPPDKAIVLRASTKTKSRPVCKQERAESTFRSADPTALTMNGVYPQRNYRGSDAA